MHVKNVRRISVRYEVNSFLESSFQPLNNERLLDVNAVVKISGTEGRWVRFSEAGT